MWGMSRVASYDSYLFLSLSVELIGVLCSYHIPCTVASSYRAYEVGYASWSGAGVDDFGYLMVEVGEAVRESPDIQINEI